MVTVRGECRDLRLDVFQGELTECDDGLGARSEGMNTEYGTLCACGPTTVQGRFLTPLFSFRPYTCIYK